MNNLLLFEFSVNKENNTVTVTREFAASRDLVWDAWTKPELLDQWWAPRPYRNKTKKMDFRVGGYWLYAMISPENETHWCKADYQKIEDQVSYSCLDAFCDEEGNINVAFPRSQWNNRFSDNGDNTTVAITVQYNSLEDLEKVIQMGFKEGFTMGLNQLDELLQTVTTK
ncbi:SRPBCC family protein [Flavisolibacter tropicus]|uniref:ATPase n=1 Tax=Flavisolibacter tropicus TaxID=1492898 RepID=A0A172TVB4_9BACT|nr:SRPBCC domain-containing protein [Flavisolibacter tropicus]ANE50824.1 ATPase [Flavisolibacter tropicus]